jgi:membrane-bound lytic murein transglycosylase D
LVSCSEEGISGQASWYARNTLYSYSGAQGNLWNHMRKDLKMTSYANNSKVRQQIRWYQHHQADLNHVIAESAPYIYYIYQQTQKRHLPAELALIPVIESAYNPYAKSQVGALGLWQMMPQTASGYGLKRNWWYDGRKDVVASTGAALHYFTYLHSHFNNDWLLAIAAYNCGQGTVSSCRRHNQHHHHAGNFWNLPLPHETKDYVPRLLAVAAIVKNPGRYHIHLAPINDAPYLEQVNVRSSITLSKAAKLAEVPVTTMKVLNPGIQHGTTDPKGPYTILVPQEKAQSFKEKLASVTHNERVAWQEHIVQSKETLELIAQKYRTTVALLAQVNELKSKKVHPNQTLLVPPGSSTNMLASNSTKATPATGESPKDQPASEQRSATRSGILSAAENTVVSLTAKVAQASTRESNADSVAPATAVTTTSNNHSEALPASYKVINGDSSKTVAKKSHATKNLRQADNSSNHLIYVVREGDYIGKIAKRYRVSSKDIKKWNQLSADDLKPGQKLVIHSA